MLVEFSPLISAGSGKIGGVVFSTGSSGACARINTRQTNPRTFARSTRHAYMAMCLNSWQGLTAAEMLVWNTTAARYPYVNRVSRTYYLSGYQFFMKMNMNLKSIGAEINTDGDIEDLLDEYTYEELLVVPDSIYVEWTDPRLNNNDNIMLFMSSPQSSGRYKSWVGDFRFIKVITSLTEQPINVTPEYEAVFGIRSWHPGQILWSYAQSISNKTGIVGVKTYKSSVVGNS